nr:DNA-binding response regulator [uncultured bacterium]
MNHVVNEVIRVLVVDDDPLVRAGLRMMLDGAAQISVVGEAGDGDAVPRALRQQAVDVVLMDIRMPNVDGITATRRLRQQPGSPHVVVLTTFDSDENIILALRAGATGFLLKDATPATIVEAVHRAAAGEPAITPTVLRRILDRVANDATTQAQARQRLQSLSGRETEVTLAVGRGLSNADISAELFLSVATVKAHITSILAKLGLENRTQLALLVHDAGPF